MTSACVRSRILMAMRHVLRALLVLCATSLFFFSYSTASAAVSADPCPGQGRISTGAGQDTAYPAGSKICPGDGSQNVINGGCNYNPYDVLEREYKSGSSKISPSNGIGGIDSALACRLTIFLKAAKEKGCNPKIISAYRSEDDQRKLCGAGGTGCAPAGASCHQKGLAVDVSTSCIGWMRMAAPQFQLVFPYYGQHIQCAEHPQANTRSCNRPCNGGAAVNPDTSQLPPPNQVPDNYYRAPQQFSAPSGGLSNQFRQALGMPQQPTTPTIQPNSTLTQPTQSQFCVPEYKCSGNDLMFQNSFCATQKERTCPAGCLNGACVQATSTDTNSNENVNQSGTSTIDILDYLSGHTAATTTTIATATPLQLISNVHDQQTLSIPQQTQSPILVATNSIATMQIGSQQTFVSSDLNSDTQGFGNSANPTGVFAVLENMRRAVLVALTYLEPFKISRSRAEQQYASYTIE